MSFIPTISYTFSNDNTENSTPKEPKILPKEIDKEKEEINNMYDSLKEYLSNMNTIENKTIDKKLQFLLEQKVILKSEKLGLIICEILNNYFEKNQYKDLLCKESTHNILLFLNTCLKLIYHNKRYDSIFQLLIRKVHSFIDYQLTLVKENEKSIFLLNELKQSFPIITSSLYRTFISNLKDNCVIDLLSKNGYISDNIKGIALLIKSIERLSNQLEQFDSIKVITKEIIPNLLKRVMIVNEEVYIKLGKFILEYLTLNEFKIDSKINSQKDNLIPEHNYIMILNDVISYDLRQFTFLNEKHFQLQLYNSILDFYEDDIIELSVTYIKEIITLETSFELQFIIFKMLKYLYLSIKNKQNLSKFEEYIPVNLNNLAKRKELKEWNQCLESREFAYHILTTENKIKHLLRSSSSLPTGNIKEDILQIKNIRMNSGYKSKLVIDSGTSKSLEYVLDKEESILFIEFSIENRMDINVHIKKIQDDLSELVIASMKKITSLDVNGDKEQNIKIVLYSQKCNHYTIEFDNTYSWLTMKTIYIKSIILYPN